MEIFYKFIVKINCNSSTSSITKLPTRRQRKDLLRSSSYAATYPLACRKQRSFTLSFFIIAKHQAGML